MRIETRRRLLGRLTAAAYKWPALSISIKTRNGAERTYRLIPSMARAGFLLSPLVETRASFAALASPDWSDALSGAAVTSVAVLSDDPSVRWYYGNDLTFAFYWLEL